LAGMNRVIWRGVLVNKAEGRGKIGRRK